MALRDDLLGPVAGENPSGKSLRYDRVYDQIKEARTEEDDTLPAGAWERTAKRADYRLVIKLASDVIATKSKDLQIAAWLGEAHIKQEGAALVAPVLTLLLDLQKAFWETMYPEIDEGDAGLRAVPLQWAANRYAALVYSLPLTKSGVDFNVYKTARAIGSEADAVGNEAKRKARAEALARGQISAEEVDAAIAASPKSFYAGLEETLRSARDVLEDLAIYCEEQYLDEGPSFRKLRDSLDEVQNLVSVQLNEKRRQEPDAAIAADPLPQPVPTATQPVTLAPVPVAAAAPPPPPAAASAVILSGPPKSWDEAAATVHACATYMSAQRSGSAVPYLLHTAIRWGELRKNAPAPPPSLCVAPTEAERERLASALSGKRWSDLQERGMEMVAEPCSRAWLDLHFYIWKATNEQGYESFSGMVVKAIQGLLADFPEIATWSLTDGTAAASAETQQWLTEHILGDAGGVQDSSDTSEQNDPPAEKDEPAPPPPQEPAAAPRPAPALAAAPTPIAAAAQTRGDAGETALDAVYAAAVALASSGQLRAACQLLARDALRQPSGRLRYRRRLEMAQLCVAAGNPGVAAPVLRELIAEIDGRQLETWEADDMVARPLELMLQCMDGNSDADAREALFARLCRIDPTAALEIIP